MATILMMIRSNWAKSSTQKKCGAIRSRSRSTRRSIGIRESNIWVSHRQYRSVSSEPTDPPLLTRASRIYQRRKEKRSLSMSTGTFKFNLGTLLRQLWLNFKKSEGKHVRVKCFLSFFFKAGAWAVKNALESAQVLLLSVRNDAKFRRNCYTTTPSLFETFHSLLFMVMAGNCCAARGHHLPTYNPPGRMRILRIILRRRRITANL